METEVHRLTAEKMSLQKQLNQAKSENVRLNEFLQENEKLLKRRTEEVEALQIYNNQLIHKCQTLQNDKKQNQWGLWWGNSTKTESRIQVLEEELAHKILENEQVHIKIFEMRQKYKTKISDLKERLSSSEQIVRESGIRVESQSIEISQYHRSIQDLIREKKENLSIIDDKNQEIIELQSFYLKSISELKSKVSFLESKLRSVVSLDLTDYDKYIKHSPAKYSKNIQFKQNEWLGKVQSSLLLSVNYISQFWVKYCTRLNALHISSLSSTKQLVSLIQSHSVKVTTSYENLVKAFTSNAPKSEILTQLERFSSYCIYFFRLLVLELNHQTMIVDDPRKISKSNQNFQVILNKISITVSRVISFLITSGCSYQSFWSRVQDSSHNLVSQIIQAIEILSSRLTQDKTLQFKDNLKELEVVIQSLQDDLKLIPNALNQFYSELMQVKPYFYYSLNQNNLSTLSYLHKLRSLPQSSGVSYQASLKNLSLLSQFEDKSKKQAESILILEKSNSALNLEINKLKSEITKIENELAAIEQNLERKNCENGAELLSEPEIISEDVKSGAQRFAVRLTDCHGEPIPLSEINVRNDSYLKIQELAVNKIQELAYKLKEAGVTC